MSAEHAITGMLIVAPSTVGASEPFEVGAKMLTKPYAVGADCWVSGSPRLRSPFNVSSRGLQYMDNVPPEWRGAVRVDGGEGYDGPAAFSFAEGSGPCVEDARPIRRFGPVRFTAPGVHFLTLTDPESGVTQRSNAIVVTDEPPVERLFWGDIHSQTYFSDGLRCPEELYSFARNEAFLDIFAMADHTEYLTDRMWDYFKAVTNDSNEPGRFVTIVGQELSSGQPWGHRNIYFPGDDGPILRQGAPGCVELSDVYEIAREHGALVIPHHSASVGIGVDWSLGHDPDVERLVEICSIWGSSERSEEDGNPRPIRAFRGEKRGQHVVDALRRGYRLGFTGGGDIHDGRPGDDLSTLQDQTDGYPLLHRQGIMGVWAKELTRQSIFEALWNRRVYATTNARIVLRFSVDGHPMGSEIVSDGTPQLRFSAHSEVPIRQVDLVKDGEDLVSMNPSETQVEWKGEDRLTQETSWYYVRVTREDGEMAGSSPVWGSR